MILQCDQCNTKFKLDDAKIKEGGVKVRCSKCKHVFVVTREPQEETDFDAILGGLGMEPPAPQAASAPATDSAEPENSTSPALTGFSQLKEALAETGQDTGKQQVIPAESGIDFSEFNFDDEQNPAPEEQEQPVKSFDLSNFNLDEEDASNTEFKAEAEGAPAPEASQEPAPQVAGAFEFDFDGGSQPEAAAQADVRGEGEEGLGFNDFTFNEENVAPEPVAAGNPPDRGPVDFDEFSFEPDEKQVEQPSVAGEEVAAPTEGAGFDFDSFDFEQSEGVPAEAAGPAAAPALPPAENEPFGGGIESLLEKDAEPFPQAPVPELSTSEAPGEFIFDFAEAGDGDTAQQEEPPAATATGVALEPAIPDLGLPSLDDEPIEQSQVSQCVSKAPVAEAETPEADVDFSLLDFGQVPSPTPAVEEASPVPLLHDLVADEKKEVPLQVPSKVDFEDEYPPLSITSRRKSGSFFTFAGLGILLLLLLVAGTGTYLLKNRPELVNKVGLGAVVQWLGIKTADEGRIAIKNTAGAFVTNKQAGELFVITGVAVNEYRKPRASIQVKALLFGKNGAIAMQKTAFCGNNLSKEQLESLPADKLEGTMGNQFGDSLSNMGLQPGKEIPFVVIFTKVPQDVGEFGVEAAGSTIAGQ